MLQKLASVERASEHPLALAIVNDALERKLTPSAVTDFDSPLGKGVVGTVDGVQVVSGSGKFLAEHGVDVAILERAAEELRAKAATVIFVGMGGKLAGFAAIADPIKATTTQALQALRAAGLRIVMLTGDGKTTAEAVGRAARHRRGGGRGVPRGQGRRRAAPDEGGARRGHGRRRRQRLAGPGRGHRGHRHGHRARTWPWRASGITLLKGDLHGHRSGADAVARGMRNIRAEPVSQLRLQRRRHPARGRRALPFFGLLLSPVVAAAAMALSSVSVIGNALRLRTVKVE